jgi:hypothetical protein
MTARAFGALTLAVSVGLASPWLQAPEPARDPQVQAEVAVATPQQRLHAALEAAARRHIPGAAASRWTLDRLDLSELGDGGAQHVVATGSIAEPGAPQTRVRLSGHYDPAEGAVSRVRYRLLPAARLAPDVSQAPAWSLQDAVEQSLAKAHPEATVRFALDSAQASRLDRGGRRFEGFGLAMLDDETRFVAFTLDLSAQGQSLAFAFGPETDAEDLASAATAD